MKWILYLVTAVGLAASAEMSLTVDQLVKFIHSAVHDLKQPDRQVAEYLKHVKMREKLDDQTIEDLQSQGAGPKTVAVLKELGTASQSLVKAAPPPPPKPPEHPSLALLGTIAGEGDGLALFMETNTQVVIRLRTGEAHQGWVLRSVHGRAAMLEKDNRTETVTLPDPGGASPGEVLQTPQPPEGRRQPRR